MDHVVTEIKKYPNTLQGAFENSLSLLDKDIEESEKLRWAQEGIRIARQTARSWEPASEYFRALSLIHI